MSSMRYSFKRAKYKTLKTLGLWKSYYQEWQNSLEPTRSSLKDHLPWITFAARDFLEERLQPSYKVFEYGTGGSTLFFAKRVESVIGIEHDEEWFHCMQEELTHSNIDNCELIFKKPTCGLDPANSPTEEEYRSHSKDYLSCKFEAYVKSIEAYPDDYFDLVVIDGRSRTSCLNHAHSKVKAGGYLLFDDTERAHYSQALQQLKAWRKVHESNGYVPYDRYGGSQTSIWKKPKTRIDYLCIMIQNRYPGKVHF